MGKKGENGVTTPLVLSMRPYAHISWNHAKRENLVKYAIYFEKPYAHSRIPYQSIRHSLSPIMYYKTNNTKSSQANMHII